MYQERLHKCQDTLQKLRDCFKEHVVEPEEILRSFPCTLYYDKLEESFKQLDHEVRSFREDSDSFAIRVTSIHEDRVEIMVYFR